MKPFLIGLCCFIGCLGLQAQDDINPALDNITIVFKTHFDIGYTDLAEAVLQKYTSSMIGSAIEVLEQTRDMPSDKHFVWTLPAWPMEQILKRSDAARKRQIEDAIREGWFVIHALPFTFQTEACDPEMLVRGLEFSTKLSRAYGVELPRDAKLTDVPSHSWFIPTLLNHAGVKILHIGCNPASSSPEIPLLFWWEGPDGSRVLTMYWAGYYGTSLTPPPGWPYKSWLAIIHTNDNQGPPSPGQVKEVLDKTARLAPNAKIKIGRISDFYEALMREKPELEVIRGDMPDTWIHGFMSMPREVKTGRHIKKDIITLETVNTLLNLWSGTGTDLRETISGASENCLLFDEHTFGMAMEHGHSGYWSYGDDFKINRASGVYKTIEDSWKEKGDRVYQAEKMIVPALKHRLEDLAGSVNVDGRRIVVYNPLPWPRDGLVTLQASTKWNPIKALQETETGKIFNIVNENNVLQFIAYDIPPLGYRTFVPVDPEAILYYNDIKATTIENAFFRIKIDTINGAIASLINKKSGKEMVGNDPDFKFGQYLYERFSKKNTLDYTKAYVKGGWNWALNEMGRPNLSDDPYRTVSGARPKIRFEKTHVSERAVMLFSPGGESQHDYSVTITLYQDLPNIEITWHIENKPAEPWPEAGWICFPFNIDHPQFRLGRLGGIVDPVRDFIRGSNFDYCFLNSGMAIYDDQGQGMGICSPDVPAISLGRPGLWRYSGYRIPDAPYAFFNLYNNQWSTNFTEWIEGSWSARFYLWSVENYDNQNSIVKPAEEVRIPLNAVMVHTKAGTLPLSASGIRLSKPGVTVGAFGLNPVGDGTLLRLWENSGTAGPCEVVLGVQSRFTEARICNLRGEFLGPNIKILDGRFRVDLEPYSPLTMLLQ